LGLARDEDLAEAVDRRRELAAREEAALAVLAGEEAQPLGLAGPAVEPDSVAALLRLGQALHGGDDLLLALRALDERDAAEQERATQARGAGRARTGFRLGRRGRGGRGLRCGAGAVVAAAGGDLGKPVPGDLAQLSGDDARPRAPGGRALEVAVGRGAPGVVLLAEQVVADLAAALGVEARLVRAERVERAVRAAADLGRVDVEQ